jgi:AraC-like DNA-binding protein
VADRDPLKDARGPRSYRPGGSLRDRILSIDVIESAAAAVSILPSTAVVLGLQYRGSVRAETGPLAPIGVTGIQATARRYAYAERTASILVRFTPEGAACLGVPASELAHRSVAISDLLSPVRAGSLHEQVCEARTEAERIAAVEGFLADLPFVRDPLVTRALALLDDAAVAGRPAAIAAVARRLSVSERQLERRFARVVGVSPKQFATLRRFERAIELARGAPSLTEAALAAGYYDQSHFIRDVRRFAGVAPGVLLGDVGFVQAGHDRERHRERRGSP